jgi:hypothetical protein
MSSVSSLQVNTNLWSIASAACHAAWRARRTTDLPIFVRRIRTSPTSGCLVLTFAERPY